MKAKGGRGQRSDNKFERISLTIEPALKARLDSKMEELGIPRSELIVKAIEQYLNSSSGTNNSLVSLIGNTSNITIKPNEESDNTSNNQSLSSIQKLINALGAGYKLEQTPKGANQLVKGSDQLYIRPKEMKRLKELGYIK